jgi:epsilon-lactone hydrolase
MKPTDPTGSVSSLAGIAIFCVILGGVLILAFGTSAVANPPQVDNDGTVHVPAFALPESSLLADETHAAFKKERASEKDETETPEPCPSDRNADAVQMPMIRKCEANALYKSRYYKQFRDRYKVEMAPKRIGGVYTEVFVPKDGIAPKSQNRVLINVHGGGFLGGSRTSSHIESIPISSVGKTKVISIDYREAPEYVFPAASEDVAAVYRELLKTYKPGNMGIYGCSAGGLLTAQAVAWLNREGLPRPGAVGMLCAGAAYWSEGDTGYFDAALTGDDLETPHRTRYLKDANLSDPLVFPARSPQVMAKFPPSLLIAATRDKALSSVVYTHSLLIAQGVDAELHVWEGLGHAFFYDPDLPESREVYGVVVKFFDVHLGM